MGRGLQAPDKEGRGEASVWQSYAHRATFIQQRLVLLLEGVSGPQGLPHLACPLSHCPLASGTSGGKGHARMQPETSRRSRAGHTSPPPASSSRLRRAQAASGSWQEWSQSTCSPTEPRKVQGHRCQLPDSRIRTGLLLPGPMGPAHMGQGLASPTFFPQNTLLCSLQDP